MMMQLLFIGTTELLLISGMALLLFGGKKLPEMMRGLGKGVKEFKKGVYEDDSENDRQPADPSPDSVSSSDESPEKNKQETDGTIHQEDDRNK